MRKHRWHSPNLMSYFDWNVRDSIEEVVSQRKARHYFSSGWMPVIRFWVLCMSCLGFLELLNRNSERTDRRWGCSAYVFRQSTVSVHFTVYYTPFTHSQFIANVWSGTIWEWRHRNWVDMWSSSVFVLVFVPEHSSSKRSVLTPGASEKMKKMSGSTA